MKKIFKVLLIIIGIVALLGGGFATFISIRGIPSFEVKAPNIKVAITPEKIKRGKQLATVLCVRCHMGKSSGTLTGNYLDDAPEQFGKIYSRNITQHKEKGIGDWTDGELTYLFRTGIAKDGRYTIPAMPKFNHMSDEDIESIISWLHSDDELLKPTDVDNKAIEPTFLTKFLCFVAFKPLPMPTEKIVTPAITDEVNYGKYLVQGVAQCFACHSASFEKMNEMEPAKSDGYMGGGNGVLDHDRKPVYSANITMDKETGIGKWTKEDFVKAVRMMQRPDGKNLRYPMEPYQQFSEAEVGCIYEYLKTVPTLNHKVDRQWN